jgi:hypothetical protein
MLAEVALKKWSPADKEAARLYSNGGGKTSKPFVMRRFRANK